MLKAEPSDTMLLTVVAPKHGGIVIYEQTADGEQTTVFGGNLADATKYFEARGAELQIRSEQKNHRRIAAMVAESPAPGRPLP